MNDDALVQFYKDLAPDNRGRYLNDILAWNDDRLEATHDYIQWLFPITTVGVNPFAPPARESTIVAFRSDPALQEAQRRSLDRMLSFYGLVRDGYNIVRATDFDSHRDWLSAENHNHLRLTRMMKSLQLLGNASDASALYRCLRTIADDERVAGRNTISSRTLRFWSDALTEQ